jgi:hypothetical protein
MTDDQLAAALVFARELERAVRGHLAVTTAHQAAEMTLGRNAYRQAVAVRKAIEDWINTREYTARTAAAASTS